MLATMRHAYLDLVKRAVTNHLYLGGDTAFEDFRAVTHYDLTASRWTIDRVSCPMSLLTSAQLDLIEQAVQAVEARRVPGDFIEAGVWRGGAIIMMRALIDAYGLTGRRVIAADSFQGIPLSTRATGDPVDRWSDRWVATLEEVKANIARFDLLDERVAFLVGFFADSLKQLAHERFALVRLDSDSYESVGTSLDYLYPLLSRGGVLIIDDWHLTGCRQAVLDYRERHAIVDPIVEHHANAYWVKQGAHRDD